MQETQETPEEFKVGQLVTVKKKTSGIKEKCMWPENFDKTIRPWDNIQIPMGTVGIVLGFVGAWHTCWVVVVWGGCLEGQKLALSENKLIKATPTRK